MVLSPVWTVECARFFLLLKLHQQWCQNREQEWNGGENKRNEMKICENCLLITYFWKVQLIWSVYDL